MKTSTYCPNAIVAAETRSKTATISLPPQVLQSCLANTSYNCRVRSEAAAALGSAPEGRGLGPLTSHVQRECFDPASGMALPNNFAEISGYLTLQAVVAALGAVRMRDGTSPPDAITLLLELLKQNDNTGNAFEDGHYVATLLGALGSARPKKPQALAAMVEEIDRHLVREAIMPSRNHTVAAACLRALTELATAIDGEAGVLPMRGTRDVLERYTAPGTPAQLCAVAYDCCLTLEAWLQPLDGTLRRCLQYVAAEGVRGSKHRLLESAFGILAQYEAKDLPVRL